MKKFLLLLTAFFLTACDNLVLTEDLKSLIEAEPNLAPISFDKPAEIEFISPAHESDDIEGQTPITFLWKEPVLALQNHQAVKAFLADHLSIEPAHPGEWRSLGTSGIMFQPEEAWKPSTLYQLTAKPDILTDLNYRFKTKTVAISRFAAETLVAQKPLTLYFNQSIDLAALGQALTLKATDVNVDDIKLDVSYGTVETEDGEPLTDKTKVELTPRTEWPQSVNYTLSLAASDFSLQGDVPTQKELTVEFQTAGPFSLIDRSVPTIHTRALELKFSAPVNSKTLAENLEITPAPEKDLTEVLSYWIENDYTSNSFYLSPPDGVWDPEVQFTVSLKPAFEDAAGRKLENYEPFVFQTNLETFFTPIYFPNNFSVFNRGVTLEPTFNYGGSVKDLEIDFNGVNKRYSLETTLKKRKIWTLDLKTEFPTAFSESGEIKAGDYRLKIKSNFAEQNRSRSYNARFFVSDFAVELKQAANNNLSVKAIPFPNQESLPAEVDMEFYVGDWQTETRFRSLENVSNDYQIEIPRDQFRMVKVTAGDLVGFGTPYFNDGMNVWDAQADFGDWKYNEQYSGALFTDRPLYKPGQTLFYKGFVRALELFGKNFPLQDVGDSVNNVAYELQIFDPEYNVVETINGTIDGGSFDGEYTLPDDLKLGNYRLSMAITNEENNQRFNLEAPFWIQEYRKPNFLITPEFSTDQAIAEEEIAVSITAAYAFGGAIVDRNVDYTITLLGEEPCRFWCWGPQVKKDKVLTRESGQLDENGTLVVPINLRDLDLEDIDWNLLTLNATVNVSEAEISSTELSIPFSAANALIKGLSVPHFFAPEDETKITGSVTDLNDEILSNTRVELKVLRTKWVRNERKNADGNFYGEWESLEEEVDRLRSETNAQGQFEFDVTAPAEGGEYSFEFSTQDTKKRTTTLKKYFWVSGNDQTRVRENNTNKILWLFPSKDSYRIGETAEVFAPNADFTPTRVHATLERGEVLETLEFDANSNTVSFVIEDWMSPNVFVSILMEGVDSDGKMQVKWGAHPIKIDDPARALSVNLIPQKMVYRPGEEVELKIETQVNGEGVKAEVAIAVVDQTLLALKSRVPLDLMRSLIGDWPLGVTTFHTLANFISVDEMETIMEEVRMLADRMEMGFGGGGGKGDDFKPRGDFRDTAAFISKFETDENGTGTATFKLPDNLTTWNIFAAGATNSNAFGTQTADFKVTLPLLVSEIVPNFLQAGDTVEMGLLVYRDNSEVETEEIEVTLNLPDTLEVVGDNTKTVSVGTEARVFFTVTVKPTTEVQTVNLGFEIEGNTTGFKDAVTLARRLQPPAQTLTAAEFQRVEEGYDITLIPAAQAISSNLTVKVFGSLSNSLDTLVNVAAAVNYGCTEQRLSALVAKLYQLNLNKAVGKEAPTPDLAAMQESRDQIEKGFVSGGGFAFWAQNNTPNFWVTTQVLEAAPLLESYQVPIELAKLEASADWLRGEVFKECNTNAWRCPSDIARVQAAAILLNYNRVTVNDLDFLKNYTGSAEAKVWWLRAAEKLGTLPPAQASTKSAYIEALKQSYNREDRFGFWTESEGAFFSQDERLTALVLETFMDQNIFENEWDTIARYLSESKKQRLSGSSAVRVLSALALYTQSQETDSVGAQFTLSNNTKNETLLKGGLENLNQVQTYGAELEGGKSQSYHLETSQPVLLDVALTDLMPAEALTENSRGFWIEREVKPFSQSEEADPQVEKLALGENYLVKLKVVTAKPHRQVLIEDPIPSGAEIVNFDLDNADQTLETPESQQNCAWGWCQPLYQHKEFRDDRARFFIDYLPAGTYEVTYVLRARLSGEFEWRPAKVEEMYAPEVAANTPGRRVLIEAQ